MEMQLRKSLKHESKCFLSDFSEREKERPLILLGQCKPNRSYLKRQENRLLNWYLGLRVFFAVQTKKKKKKPTLTCLTRPSAVALSAYQVINAMIKCSVRHIPCLIIPTV